MTVPYYLIAAAVALFGLLVLVFLAVKLRRALRRFGQVRGWLDEYLTDRTRLVRARTAALGIAVCGRPILVVTEGQCPHPRATSWRGIGVEDAADDSAIGKHVEIVGIPSTALLRAGSTSPPRGCVTSPARRGGTMTAAATAATTGSS